jgi:GTP-binding protein
MRFVDEVLIDVRGGDGGAGAVSFRRESHVPFGGPDGGDGGRGGDVVVEADAQLGTLLEFRYRPRWQAPTASPAAASDCNGKRGGKDLVMRVPVGTVVLDKETGEPLADLTEKDQRVVVAQGRPRRPRQHELRHPLGSGPPHAPARRDPGTKRKLRLELKLLADVGILGFPNAGKSTFIAAVSRARPKVADYPFTTLVPNLGVVRVDVDRSFVMADIPGLIPGAAQGAGLGIRFLKHVERTRVLLHIITLDPDPGRAPLDDFDVIVKELANFDAELAKRPMMIAVSKIDLPDVQKRVSVIRKGMKKRGHEEVHAFSAATGEGVQELLVAIEAFLKTHEVRPQPRAVPLSGRKPGDDIEGAEEEEGVPLEMVE